MTAEPLGSAERATTPELAPTSWPPAQLSASTSPFGLRMPTMPTSPTTPRQRCRVGFHPTMTVQEASTRHSSPSWSPPVMSRTHRCQPGPRWQLSIVYTGALRFSEFADAVSSISP